MPGSAPTNKRFFPRTLSACAVLFALPLAGAGPDSDDDDPMRWDRAEAQLVLERYPREYIDSVMAAKGVGDNRGMGDSVSLPFTYEKLVFDGGWGFLRAGWGILIAERDDDSAVYHFIGKVLSNNFVSTFYKVRDYIHTVCDANSLYPLLFEQHIQEGRYGDHRWNLYDHQNGMVYYHDKKRELESPAQAGIHNYLSLLYALRTRELVPKDTFSIRTFYHRKDFPIKFTVHCRETIEVPAGAFECFKLEPRLMGEGRGFTKRDKLTVWIADDEARTPVMVKAKIKLGSLSARLLHYERK
ncbi:MAG: DUF3108 domain-containing protein [Chitinivibrionales bacterium]|nr:DUF3108 domain-containing protein [Chitinivibrionales bacterium]MBD3394697.1 DUF3108 domain-containing protein [Chitinivibrionales bacterium]